MSRDNSSGFLKGIIFGGLVGAGVALMLAPQEGEKTRKELKKKTKDLQKKAQQFVDDLAEDIEENRDEINDKIRKVSSMVEKSGVDLSAFLGEEKKTLEKKVAETKKTVAETKKNLEKVLDLKEAPAPKPEAKKQVETVEAPKKVSNEDVELARKILSRASGRSFYKKK